MAQIISRPVLSVSVSSALAAVLLLSSPAWAAGTPSDTKADAPATDTGGTAAPAAGDNTGSGTDSNGAIVVTAQHRVEKLQDVPSAISVLEKDQFEVGGVGRSANEILNYVPNASAATQQHGRPRWWIRGVGAGLQNMDMASPVGFYLDDVYISNANATAIPLFDLERVEVLRGPQGTLWGKNTTGGAINVVNTRPHLSPDDQDNYLKLEYGSYDDKIAEGGVGAAVIPEKLAVRLSFRVDDRGDRFTNLFTEKSADSVKDEVFRGQILAKPVENLEILLSAHYRRYTTDGDYWTTASYAPTGVYRNGYVPSTNINDISENAPTWSNTSQGGGSLHIDWHPGAITVTAITGYEHYQTRGAGDSDYSPLEISRSYTASRSNQWTQELRVSSPQGEKLTWIGGLFYFNEKIGSDAYSGALPPGSVPAAAGFTTTPAYSWTHYNHKAESGAVFGSATYTFNDLFKITGGLRWSRETKTLYFNREASLVASFSNYSHWWDSYTGTIGGAGTFNDNLKDSWNALTWDVTPTLTINRNNLLYFKAAYGVKSGGFNTSAALPVALNVVAPERLHSFEIGYKSTWFGGKLTFNATAFHYDYQDVQLNVVGPVSATVGATSTSYIQNAAHAHSNGVEFEFAARPVERVKLGGSLGLLYTRYDQLQVINGGANLSGAQFVRSPHVSVNGNASYTLPLPHEQKLEFEADVRYTSRQYYYVTPQDVLNRYYTTQGAYALANARITYTTGQDKISVSIFANNFTNTRYLNHALPGAQGTTVTGDIVAWGDPRTWGISGIYRF